MSPHSLSLLPMISLWRCLGKSTLGIPCCAVLLGLCLIGLSAADAAVPDAKDEGELTKLREGVYVFIASPDSNAVSNSGVVVLEHAVLVFDTHFTPEAGLALLNKIQAVTSKPVRYVVNSHFHPDHTHGNQAFAKAPQIISSTNARRDILQKDQPAMKRMLAAAQSQIDRLNKELVKAETPAQRESISSQVRARKDFLDRMARQKIVAPTLTVDDELIIQDGPREIRLMSPGSGHTDGDLVLFLPAEKVVFLGDLFFSGSFPNAQDANFLEWTKTIAVILKLDAEKYVPGHGAVGSRKDVEAFLTYMEELRTLVEPAVSRGDPVDQAVRDIHIPEKYKSYGFAAFFPANVQKMFSEIKAIQMVSPTVTSPEETKRPEPEKPQP